MPIKTEERQFNLSSILLHSNIFVNDIYIISNIEYLILIKYFFINAKWFSIALLCHTFVFESNESHYCIMCI